MQPPNPVNLESKEPNLLKAHPIQQHK